MKTTPYDTVAEAYKLPFDLWPMQQDCVNQVAPLKRGGYYAEVGTGKTAMSTIDALYQQLTGMSEGHIVVMPPILQTAWLRWLQRFPGVTAVGYRGTPKQRSLIDLSDADFIVMSIQIFKQDFEYLYEEALKDRHMGGLVDEATSIKNVESANYRRVREFFQAQTLRLLTGKPCATPGDSYAYIKLIAPEIYRNRKVFDSVHVVERDFFGQVKEWGNLELLKKNMEVGTVRLLKAEVLPHLKQPLYDPIRYTLEPEHMALYRELMETQILELETGGKIDASTPSKLFNCAQQIVANLGYFSGDPAKKSATLDLVDEVIAELSEEGRKLIIYGTFQMTMRLLMEHLKDHNPQLINGSVTPKQQELAKERFISDPSVKILLIQPKSGGYGLDGLQDVCSDILFVEQPTSPIDFEQCVGRLYRSGQAGQPHVRVAIAEGTVQVRLHNLLLNNDELSTYVQGGWKSLKEAIYGAE